MAWKKDLEKIKKALEPEPSPPPKAPVRPKPAESRPLAEEDAVFLSAMGHRSRPAAPAPLPSAAPPPRPAPSAAGPSEGEFAAAMGDLKGLVALRSKDPGTSRPAPEQGAPAEPAAKAPDPRELPVPEARAAQAPQAPAAPVPEARPPAVREAAPDPALPAQINLAAGMAIDVDGVLDLKGHSRSDAEERLKERILDGHALGWRSLHVVLGPSEDLRLMLLDLVKGASAPHLSRYAQAPIPMGGSQAWILYFRSPAPDAP